MTSLTLPASFQLEFDSALAEESVLSAIGGHCDEVHFRQARDRIYRVAGEEERERQFFQLHRDWFTRLGLETIIVRALTEQPTVVRYTRGCRVLNTIFRKDEGADLFGSAPKVIGLKLRPRRLVDEDPLTAFLRHELMHLSDMLDPCFGYEPELRQAEAGPVLDSLLRERYRVLWDCWIDARLLRQGWAPPQVRQNRLVEFKATFPMLGQRCEVLFAQWFDQPFHTHQELVMFALHPGSGGQGHGTEQRSTGRCPLCQFPSFDWESGANLSEEVREKISSDSPGWTPHQGLCRQCAELYRSRQPKSATGKIRGSTSEPGVTSTSPRLSR